MSITNDEETEKLPSRFTITHLDFEYLGGAAAVFFILGIVLGRGENLASRVGYGFGTAIGYTCCSVFIWLFSKAVSRYNWNVVFIILTIIFALAINIPRMFGNERF